MSVLWFIFEKNKWHVKIGPTEPDTLVPAGGAMIMGKKPKRVVEIKPETEELKKATRDRLKVAFSSADRFEETGLDLLPA